MGLISFESKAHWFLSEARFQMEIHQRSIGTIDGTPTFLYFDGATMMTYQYPSKASEVVWCRGQLDEYICDQEGRGFDHEMPNFPLANFEVRRSGFGENSGRGVFSLADIPPFSYLGLESAVHQVVVDVDASHIIELNLATSKLFADSKYAVLHTYMYAYGFQASPRVSS